MNENKLKYQEKVFSVKVKKDWIPEDYNKHVDESILKIKFKPDIFQKQAFYFLSRQESIFVSAHTSAGKTLVAEYAIALSESEKFRTIYTSPIKALSNQKFYDFKQKFDDVGIITGDVQVNPSARCLIMTTEILRNLIYKNNDILHSTRFIIFDEVHYINDSERGVVWEECLIMLPKHITLVLLSATIPNSQEFSDWVGRTKRRTIYIISTDKRPVPLEFYIYSDREIFYLNEPKPNTSEKILSNIKTKVIPYSKKSTPTCRFKIMELANFVIRKKLSPVIFFCFSKKKCEQIIGELDSLDLTTIQEKRDINNFLRKAIEQLPEGDRSLPQILNLKKHTKNGIAVHHGALLPFIKECVEILFSLNLIKILIATETFAMGVNMPAKCVVFLSLSKIDGEKFRNLTTGEFTQMSGRAGRRGSDRVGTVLIADEKTPSLNIIKGITQGVPNSLNSQFKLSFGLILTALRSNVKVEELMKKSYKEHFKQKYENRDIYNLSKLDEATKVECSDIYKYIRCINKIVENSSLLIKKYKLIKTGDIVLTLSNELFKIKDLKGDFLHIEKCHENSNFLLPKNFINLENAKITYEDIFCIIKNGDPFFDFKITNAEDFLLLKKIIFDFKSLSSFKCINCKDFSKHLKDALKYLEIENEINRIKHKYSIDNLEHIEEYINRVKFLEKNNFIDKFVTLKGRVAAELRTVNEVLSTEMIFDNEFKNFEPAVIISLFSSMICDEQRDEYNCEEKLLFGIKRLEFYYEKFSKDMETLCIPPFKPLNFTLSQAVYDWCHKETLQNIVTKYEVSEGDFVRLILRLDECCREMMNACVIIEDENLESKFKKASEMLKQDIVFMPSLYL